jgi:transcriptional regulator with XRE-family HTH domain
MMPHNVDIHVGRMMRQRRWLVGMTQQQLAETVGIKFQQIQKYETGANRVSASRLWDIAGALGVPMTHFFDGIEHIAPPEAVTNSEQAPADFLNNKEVMDLVRSYYAIPKDLRRRVIDLARVLGGAA